VVHTGDKRRIVAVSHRRTASLVAAGLILIGTVASAAPVAAKSHVRVLLSDLSSPKGIDVGGKSIFVSQGWAGAPGPVLEYRQTGRAHRKAQPITDPLNLVDIVGTPDGAGWAIGTDGVLYRQATPGGPIDAVLDIFAYQAADPDPTDKDDPPNPGESNPNGLAALPNNDVLIADAAGNDVLRVSPDGTAVTVARWPNELVGTDHLGDPNLPPLLPAEAVPTTVAIGPDGWAYVGQLVGFPAKPGSAHIWRVNPNAEGAVCAVDVQDPSCSVWKSGFTSIFDIAFNPNNGTLYVYEIAEDGWLAFEEGFQTGEFPPAVLLKVKGHKQRELARGQLSQPGGVEVAKDGKVFVTDGMFTGGRLIRIAGN
jgi:hypothetical protein